MTDGDGKTHFKGFYGKYRLTFDVAGKTVEKEIDFSKKASNRFEIIL